MLPRDTPYLYKQIPALGEAKRRGRVCEEENRRGDAIHRPFLVGALHGITHFA